MEVRAKCTECDKVGGPLTPYWLEKIQTGLAIHCPSCGKRTIHTVASDDCGTVTGGTVGERVFLQNVKSTKQTRTTLVIEHPDYLSSDEVAGVVAEGLRGIGTIVPEEKGNDQ